MFKLLRWFLCTQFDCMCGGSCGKSDLDCPYCYIYAYHKCVSCKNYDDCQKKRVPACSMSRDDAIIRAGGVVDDSKA